MLPPFLYLSRNGGEKLQSPYHRSWGERKKTSSSDISTVPVLAQTSRGRAEQSQDPLVHAKHDGGARHRPHQVGRHAAVQAREALLEPDAPEALHQARVLGPAVGHGRLS